METPNQGAKDPAVGTALSLFMPGLGHLYAGRIGSFVAFLVIETWLVSESNYVLFLIVHVFQAIAAGGAVKQWNQRQQAGLAMNVPVPPPPPAGTGRARAAATVRVTPPAVPPAPTPARAPLVLSPDSFLEEIQAAWREHRSSHATARQFADRKWRAIRSVHVDHREDGEALVAAARELSAAGVLTSEEIGQLAARVEAA
jgi:TM2 domain-containing membrane protein YozV